jgi:hypothetical protein
MGLVISKGLTLKSYNTPAAIAGVAPTLDYRFALDRREIEAISLTDKLTYTGATNGTFVNRAGLIERATTDQPGLTMAPPAGRAWGCWWRSRGRTASATTRWWVRLLVRRGRCRRTGRPRLHQMDFPGKLSLLALKMELLTLTLSILEPLREPGSQT